MDFKLKRKSTKSAVLEGLLEMYPHDLQMYKIPPVGDLCLQEFETLALERLTLLRSLSAATTLKGLRLYSEEWCDFILTDLRNQGLKYYVKLCEKSGCNSKDIDLQARQKDHIAHFILRLAYCRTEELRRWFISREIELFRMRFMRMKGDAFDIFFNINNLYYTNISEEEKNENIVYLRESTYHQNVENMKFFKVKFSEVLDLVKMRKVFLKDGYAYISHKDFISVLTAQYRLHLRQSLAIACHHLGEIEQDERLVSLFKGLHQSYIGNDYSDSKSVINIEALDSLSTKSFPLCMRQVHEYLRSTHHLKHGGRLQYGLFLKGIGVTLEDSLRFWREEFTKIMDLDKFEKQYSYNVRYNYGKEGSKKNFSPYNCLKIIGTNIGPGECHGCPFKHSDVHILKNKLKGYGVDQQAVYDIVDLSKRGHYQIACSKYFDTVHSSNFSLGINHPNQYYEESQKLVKGALNMDPIKEIKPIVKDVKNDIEDMDFEENF